MKGFTMPQTVLGPKLKKLRNEKNLTQGQLSKILGFSGNYINQIENGQKISLGRLQKIAKFFQVPVEYLVSEKEDNAVPLPIRNQELLKVMLEMDKMETKDQQLLLDMAEVIMERNRLKKRGGKKMD
jgi:transcriptional regulator with XRE-family HTH domain